VRRAVGERHLRAELRHAALGGRNRNDAEKRAPHELVRARRASGQCQSTFEPSRSGQARAARHVELDTRRVRFGTARLRSHLELGVRADHAYGGPEVEQRFHATLEHAAGPAFVLAERERATAGRAHDERPRVRAQA
jgi:hypothetical protein